METRRKFLKYIGLMAGSSYLSFQYSSLKANSGLMGKKQQYARLMLKFEPYELQLKHVFTIAAGSRTTTPVMLTSITWNGMTGYGEASMPPYLGESHATTGLR